MIRAMIVDDHSVLRAGLRAILSQQADFVVVADAGDADSAYQAAIEHRPDLVVLDLSMPRGGAMA